MSRIRTFVTIMLPSMLAGGLLFGAASGHAAANDPDDGFWPNPAPVVIAQADPPPPPAPPRVAPPAPRPPKPPVSPAGGSGFSVSIDNGKIQITGVRELVKTQLAAARDSIKNNPHIPPDVRAKILARLDKVGATVDKRIANMKLTDLDQLGDEMDKMGEELEQALEGLDEDLEKLGESLGKNIKIDLGKLHDIDVDDMDLPSAPDLDDVDDSDMRDAINDLKDLALDAKQRDQITKLRAQSDRQVADAKKQIAELSEKLHTTLENPGATDTDISRLVDQISGHEATMRKARILAWAQARRVLDAAQRKKVEDAAAKAKKTK